MGKVEIFLLESNIISLRSKRFRTVLEQRKIEERRETEFSVLAARKMERELSFLFSYPLPALLLAAFFARSLTLVPSFLLRNQKKTLATQATT